MQLGEHAAELAARDADVLIVTSYDSATVAASVARRGYTNTFLVDAEPLIEAFGLTDPGGRDGIPIPATVVIGPDGRIASFVTTTKTTREPLEDVFAAIDAVRRGQVVVPPAAPAAPADMAALGIEAIVPTLQRGEAGAIRLVLTIPAGAHLYGEGEEIGTVTSWTVQPTAGLSLGEVTMPSPTQVTLDDGAHPLYSGRIELRLPVTPTAGATDGLTVRSTLRTQLCTATWCGAPTTTELPLTLRFRK